MENFLSGAVTVVFIPIVAFVFKAILHLWLRGKTKEVIAKTSEGKVESFTVAANASDAQIADSVRQSLVFERHVYDALKKIVGDLKGFEAHQSRQVDFIAQFQGKKLAIECKDSVDRLSEESIERYLKAEDGLSKLLLVSRRPPSSKVMELTRHLVDSGRVSFLNVSNDEEILPQVWRAVRQELRVP
jgi:hypothetical protein